VGVDIDPQALVAARENATRNGVAGTFVLPDRLIAAERFDVVVANILANPLILLACALAARVVAGGRIVLSGILASQADEVIAAYAPWFRIGRGETEDGWVALVGERSAVRTAV
jgi:ribosomal protein L11 methyltransferase